MKEMAFRSHFFIAIFYMVLSLGGSIGALAVVFSNTEKVGEWTGSLALVVTGTYFIMDSLRGLCVGPSLNALSGLDGDLWQGTFDFVLLKPIPPLFHVSVRRWDPTRLIQALLSVTTVVVGCIRSDVTVSVVGMLGFLLMLAIGFIIVYSILLILASAAFWYLGTFLIWIFDSVAQTARYPIGIYPKWISLVLTWVIPLAFIATVPAESLLYGVRPHSVISGSIVAVILLVGSVSFFRKSLGRYASASS